MTNYKTFLRIIQKNLGIIIMYTVILVVFSLGNVMSGGSPTNFAASKPDVTIYDEDKSPISKGLVEYFEKNANVVEIKKEGDNLNDALYFNNIDYVVYLEKGFGEKIANGEDFKIIVNSEGNYDAFLSETILNRYTKIAKNYAGISEERIAEKTKTALEYETEVELNSSLDTNGLSNAELYFNFLNYSILAGLVFAVAYATIGFRRRMVKKRITASSTSYRKINGDLLVCSFALSLVLWVVYVTLGIIIVGADVIFTTNGLLFVLNSLVLTVFAVVFALFLTNLVEKTGALNAVVNIVSLGSSFICGVFIPTKWMPEFVVGLAKIFPSFYYIDNNRIIAGLDKYDFEHLWPMYQNMLIILGVTVALVILNSVITRKKRKE